MTPDRTTQVLIQVSRTTAKRWGIVAALLTILWVVAGFAMATAAYRQQSVQRPGVGWTLCNANHELAKTGYEDCWSHDGKLFRRKIPHN